jgi:excisionase family DNA binding protein
VERGPGEVSVRLGVTLRTLYRLIDEGRLPAYKMGRVIRLRHDVVNLGPSVGVADHPER